MEALASGNSSVIGFNIFHFELDLVRTPLVLTIWILVANISKITFHSSKRFPSWIPESCVLITSGIIYGMIFYLTKISTKINYPWLIHVFFFVLLPPIVLDAGYYLYNDHFFNNLGTILCLAVVGTLWNTLAIGLSLYGLSSHTSVFNQELDVIECLLFGSLVSAVDPVSVLAVFEEVHVNEILYIIMFGESLLNDGISVVLYNLFLGFKNSSITTLRYSDLGNGVLSFSLVSVGGIMIGIIIGIVASYATRYTERIPEVEPLFMYSMAYLSYLVADLFEISGILAIVTCALVQQRYASNNLCTHSRTTTMYMIKMFSSVCESMIFLWLGLSMFGDYHAWNTNFILFSLLFSLVCRFVGIVTLIGLANRWRMIKLDAVEQFILSYSGLRGAIAFALALSLNKNLYLTDGVKRMFLTTTIVIVLFTTFFQGMTIKPLVEYLRIKKSGVKSSHLSTIVFERSLDCLINGVESIVNADTRSWTIERLERWECRWIKPLLLKCRPHSADAKLIELCQNLNIDDISRHMRQYGGNHCSLCRYLSNLDHIHDFSAKYSLRDDMNPRVFESYERSTLKPVVVDFFSGQIADEADLHHIKDLFFKPKKAANVYDKLYLVDNVEDGTCQHKVKRHNSRLIGMPLRNEWHEPRLSHDNDNLLIPVLANEIGGKRTRSLPHTFPRLSQINPVLTIAESTLPWKMSHHKSPETMHTPPRLSSEFSSPYDTNASPEPLLDPAKTSHPPMDP